MRPTQLASLVPLLLLAACVVTPPAVQAPVDEDVVKKANQVNPAGLVPPEVLASPTAAPAGSLVGTVYAPAGIVAAGGMNLVAAGGLNLVAAGGLNYAVLAGPAAPAGRRLLSLAQEPVGGAPVQLFDATNKPVGEPILTDAKTGQYIFPKAPTTGGPFILKVGVKTATGNAALEAIVRPDEIASVDVDAVTTIVTAGVLARTGGKLDTVRARDFKRAVSYVAGTLSDEAVPDLTKPQALADAFAGYLKGSSDLRTTMAALAGEKAPTTPGGTSTSPGPAPSGSPGASADPQASTSPGASTAPGTSPSPSVKPSPIATAEPPTLTGLASLRTFSIFAGSDTAGFKDGARLDAFFKSPAGVAVDPNGFVYVADVTGHLVRRVDPGSNGKVATLAGLNATSGDAVASATGIDARFNFPIDLVAVSDTTLFVLDKGNRCIRKLTHANGESVTVEKFSGKGTEGVAEGDATNCSYDHPVAIAYDGVNTLFVADYTDSGSAARILAVDATSGAMTIYAGGATKGSKDGAVATATFGRPGGLAVRTLNGKREVWVADQLYGNIRRIRETDAGTVVSTAAGAVEPLSGTTGDRNTLPLDLATFNRPGRMTFTPEGDLLILDNGSGRVRWLRFNAAGEPAEVRALQPPPGSGITTPFKVEGTSEGLSGLAYSAVTETVFVTMGSLARVAEIR